MHPASLLAILFAGIGALIGFSQSNGLLVAALIGVILGAILGVIVGVLVEFVAYIVDPNSARKWWK